MNDSYDSFDDDPFEHDEPWEGRVQRHRVDIDRRHRARTPERRSPGRNFRDLVVNIAEAVEAAAPAAEAASDVYFRHSMRQVTLERQRRQMVYDDVTFALDAFQRLLR